MKLIDKDAVLAEIERRKQVAFGWMETAPNDAVEAEFELCDDILSFINSLEVKEVDLEKEISFQWSKFCLNGKDKNSFVDFAKHFFELGISVSNKAQKGEGR